MATVVTPGVRERLETLYEMCQLLVKQIAVGRGSGASERASDLLVFFNQLVTSSRAVSDGCTKLSLLFSHPPCPTVSDCGSLCAMLEQRVMALVSTHHKLDKSFGRCLVKEVEQAVRTIVEGVEHLARVIAAEGCASDCHSRLQGTGSVWEACANISSISRDNRAATLKLLISQLHLLTDASSEVDKLVENKGSCGDDDPMLELEGIVSPIGHDAVETSEGKGETVSDEEREEENHWSHEEMPLVTACVQLVKCSVDVASGLCRAVVSHATALTEEQIGELDTTVDIIQRLSPLVDDLVCEMEVPVDKAQLKLNGSQLQQVLLETLDKFSALNLCKLARSSWNIEDQRKPLAILNLHSVCA